jgi:response regulator RpfG family c-di-GMP phosphodiesterase
MGMAEKAILLVDDESLILLSLKRSLRLQFGSEYRYETAVEAEEGLARIGDLTADGVDVVLVISDWLMPGMNGDEFLARVQRLYPGTRLIMVTGHADESDLAKLAEEVKIEAFLRKPWEPERLFKAVSAALGRLA